MRLFGLQPVSYQDEWGPEIGMGEGLVGTGAIGLCLGDGIALTRRLAGDQPQLRLAGRLYRSNIHALAPDSAV